MKEFEPPVGVPGAPLSSANKIVLQPVADPRLTRMHQAIILAIFSWKQHAIETKIRRETGASIAPPCIRLW